MTDTISIQVKEATGPLLDYLVALARHREQPMLVTTNIEHYREQATQLGYSEAHIERVVEHMDLEFGVVATVKDCQTTKLPERQQFQALYPYHKGLSDNLLPSEIRGHGGGLDVLRAYVAKHLGDAVEVPALLVEKAA